MLKTALFLRVFAKETEVPHFLNHLIILLCDDARLWQTTCVIITQILRDYICLG
jgi:hypothetical protein